MSDTSLQGTMQNYFLRVLAAFLAAREREAAERLFAAIRA